MLSWTIWFNQRFELRRRQDHVFLDVNEPMTFISAGGSRLGISSHGTLDHFVVDDWVEDDFLGSGRCLHVSHSLFSHTWGHLRDVSEGLVLTLDEEGLISAFVATLHGAVGFCSLAHHGWIVAFGVQKGAIPDVQKLLAVLSLFFAEGTDCSQSSADGAGVVKIVTVKTVNVVSDFGFSQFENAVLVNFFLFDDREIVNADVLHGMTISRLK